MLISCLGIPAVVTSCLETKIVILGLLIEQIPRLYLRSSFESGKYLEPSLYQHPQICPSSLWKMFKMF
jgi:hypothetical protein